MVVLTKGQASQNLIVTLNEKRTLDAGYYLFVFTHILTRQVVTKIYNFLDDESSYQSRYNSFEIDTSAVFTGPVGDWLYNVYEQASAVNTDPAGLTEVERGIMRLNPATDFSFASYNEPTTYTAYAG